MPPPQTPETSRDIPSPLLGLLALFALPLALALYATLLFALCGLALHTLRWLLTP